MRPTTIPASRAMPGLLMAAVVAIVLGIIGMHALNTHAAMSDTDHAAMSMTADTHADMPVHASLGDPAAATSIAAGVADGGNGHDMGTMVMLCAAMLAAAGALILLTFALRRTPLVWAHLAAAPATVPRWVTTRVGNGPPPVWEFSVIRC